jgi:hypothetical protein
LPRIVVTPLPVGRAPFGSCFASGIRRVSLGEQIRREAVRTGLNQRCIKGWRLWGSPPRSASRPARGTAVPHHVAVYRGPRSASGSAGFEERCRLKDRTAAGAPHPASLEPWLSWTFTLSQATRTPRSTVVAKFSSVMGTSNGRLGRNRGRLPPFPPERWMRSCLDPRLLGSFSCTKHHRRTRTGSAASPLT